MNEENEKRLLEKFKNLFEPDEIRKDPMKSCMAFGFETANGWNKLIEDMLTEVNEELKKNPIEDFAFVQIKEKFGSLRAYTQNTSDVIHDIIRKYEKISAVTCEICGEAGEILDVRGWYSCLCKTHHLDKLIKRPSVL